MVSLRHEYEMMRKVYQGYPKGYKINGIPRLYHFGKSGLANCMVMELLGANLEDLFELVGHQFSMKTVLMIAFQLLDRIEQVHKRGLVYRDVKPENFLLGRKESKDFNIIHLVDFGLATFYRDPITGKHLTYKDVKTMTGTARYMSIHSHLGKLQSRRDDLESIGYVLIYFALGQLPWQGLKAANLKDKYKKIRDAKMRYPVHVLCQDLPAQFSSYLAYVKKMGFYDEPDYEYLKERDLFHELYEHLNYSYEDSNFDWSCLNLPSDVQRYNYNQKVLDGSQISSNNTEDSEHMEDLEELSDPRQNETGSRPEMLEEREMEDKVGELRNIRDQTRTMEFSNSKWNVKSLSVTNSGNILVCDSINQQDLDEAMGMNTNESCSQGYFSNSESELVRENSTARLFLDRPKIIAADDKHSDRTRANNENFARADDIIAVSSFNENAEEKAKIYNQNKSSCRCTETCITEQRVSFLCFTWKKQKRDVTYHGEKCSTCSSSP